MKKILLTGCAGFIGSNFVHKICTADSCLEEYQFVILDALTYAGHYPSIQKVVEKSKNLSFVKMDIRDGHALKELFLAHRFTGVINFAAESHVDRSIDSPNIFIETNVLGTLNLLNCSLELFRSNPDFRYLQVSTDEVYGSLKLSDPAFIETTNLSPNSPYSASKASADMLVRSYYKTFKLPALITRCSNNYGPFQYPEKLIPLMIYNATKSIPLPVYGTGSNIRDWIFVDDHNHGVWEVFKKGRVGEVYNLGGDSEMVNLEIVKLVLKKLGKSENLIQFVTDRLGHDFRYAMNFSKAKQDLGWSPKVSFEHGLEKTLEWYKANWDWVETVKLKSSK
ncbi:MAG: dTDP-glucose 4,6-dehydratase [Bdellovibrionales bacterium GWA2_49_15]|nr:MAG: dTDP-glucose 4,6-dehydratase [Bdellovibrionales bacterium GWA2_49_15]